MNQTKKALLHLLINGSNMNLKTFQEKYIKAIKDELKLKVDRLKKLK